MRGRQKFDIVNAGTGQTRKLVPKAV